MSPARLQEDPVTAEYDIYLTKPVPNDQIYLLQYPNRPPEKPYNSEFGAVPREMRIKPQSGHLELDLNLDTDHNFNKHSGLRWGDAMKTSKEVQNESATYGMAAGFTGLRGGVNNLGRRVQVRDEVDRDQAIADGLMDFEGAERADKVMNKQTLGGQIMRHDGPAELGKPSYFVGAFRGSELHLTKVSGTVQMRPQFHHLDAEDQRNRLATSRAALAAVAGEGDGSAPEVARVVHQTFKPTTINPRGELEQREFEMKTALASAHEEAWLRLEYVDEEAPEAFDMWKERMLVQDTREEAGCARLKSSMGNEEYLDAISAPGKEGQARRRKRVRKGKGNEIVELEDEDEAAAEGG